MSEITIPYQPYTILDEDSGEEAEGVLFVLRLDMEAKNPVAQVAAREAILRYASLHPDREHAKLCVEMICQIKGMSTEATETLWDKVEEAYNKQPVYFPRPGKKVVRRG